MRRKLIKAEAYEALTQGSTTSAGYELAEAAGVLAKAIGKEYLSLHCFNGSTALYETLDNTFVHAGYDIDNGQITFTNIEELIVDHDSKKAKMKESLGHMLDALIVDNNELAEKHLQDYLSMFKFSEAKKAVVKTKGDPKDHDFQEVEVDDKKDDKKKKPGKSLPPWLKDKQKKGKEKADKFSKSSEGKNFNRFKDSFKKRVAAKDKKIKEAFQVACNVLDYVDYVQLGPVLGETTVKRDENGNPVEFTLPTAKVRNEGKILSFDWKTLNSKVKTMRESALSLHENELFVKAMADLKKQNAVSNAEGLETVLENITVAFPQTIYLTRNELAQIISESLQIAGVKNFDDQTCQFMAEGIGMKATAAYQDKVNQILHLASSPCAEGTDLYTHFQTVIEGFYPSVDEKFGLERKAFEDLYNTLEDIYKTADRQNDNSTKHESARYINEVADILNAKVKPDLEVAEEAANYILSFVETNLETAAWNVSNTPHITVSGDHPDMAKKASHGYAPSKDFSGNWGDEAPMIGQDDMNYKGKHSKEARTKSWGNVGGSDTFPSLKNPYIPKPFGDYTMKGEKGADKETNTQGTWQSNDTWPNLNNPYVPKAETPDSYKMNHGKEKDLVVSK